jgi:plasmid stability protein
MATALVRDLDEEVYERLKARAAGNNRSLEA